MAYIHYGQELSSGNISESYVTREPDCLKNISGHYLPCEKLRELFDKNDDELHKVIGSQLYLTVEEADVVCDKLFEERDNGQWR